MRRTPGACVLAAVVTLALVTGAAAGPTILLVDKAGDGPPGGNGLPYESEIYFRELLGFTGYEYDVYDAAMPGDGPDSLTMQNYTTQIWFTSTWDHHTITRQDQWNLVNWLYQSHGGVERNLLMTGNNIGYDLIDAGNETLSFFDTWLGCEYLADSLDDTTPWLIYCDLDTCELPGGPPDPIERYDWIGDRAGIIGAEEFARYVAGSEELSAGVAHLHPTLGYQTVTLGFGMEFMGDCPTGGWLSDGVYHRAALMDSILRRFGEERRYDCWYAGRKVEDMTVHEEWDEPPCHFTETTVTVADGAAGWAPDRPSHFFIMDMEGTADCGGQIDVYRFGLIVRYDALHDYVLSTVRLPTTVPTTSHASYSGLAYDESRDELWYSRAHLGPPPLPPGCGLYHIDSDGASLGYYSVHPRITGLAMDPPNDDLWMITRGDPDSLWEFDVSTGVPVLTQGPAPVPWPAMSTEAAAGIAYGLYEPCLYAVDSRANEMDRFTDIDPGYGGPPGPGEPGVSLWRRCPLERTDGPWGICADARAADTFRVVGGRSRGPFPVDAYAFGWAGSVEDGDHDGLLDRPHLSQNHPNPFGSTTSIAYAARASGPATISIYSVSGRLIRTYDLGPLAAGAEGAIEWDGRNRHGDECATGVYFCRFASDGPDFSRRMVLLRWRRLRPGGAGRGMRLSFSSAMRWPVGPRG